MVEMLITGPIKLLLNLTPIREMQLEPQLTSSDEPYILFIYSSVAQELFSQFLSLVTSVEHIGPSHMLYIPYM